jgi:threonine dehydrogenase-like Zn-dependent dehydrogenase
MEAHGHSIDAYMDEVKQKLRIHPDRAMVLRQAIQVCRKGGTVSVPGVYAGFIDKIPFGAAFGKALTFKMGQTHMIKYMQPLLDRIQKGEIDMKFLISHRIGIEQVPQMYKTWVDKEDNATKIVIDPWAEAA